jgi:hypothetical protein
VEIAGLDVRILERQAVGPIQDEIVHPDDATGSKELAEKDGMQRTTLTRNLRPLTRAKWVVAGTGKDRRQHLFQLTAAGRRAKALISIALFREHMEERTRRHGAPAPHYYRRHSATLQPGIRRPRNPNQTLAGPMIPLTLFPTPNYTIAKLDPNDIVRVAILEHFDGPLVTLHKHRTTSQPIISFWVDADDRTDRFVLLFPSQALAYSVLTGERPYLALFQQELAKGEITLMDNHLRGVVIYRIPAKDFPSSLYPEPDAYVSKALNIAAANYATALKPPQQCPSE